MNIKKIKDERIEKIQNRYGTHAFIIVSALLFSSILFKSVVMNLPFKEYLTELVIFLIGMVYYTIKITNAGLFHTVKESKIHLITSFALISILFGILVGLTNMFRYQNGQFNEITMFSISILTAEAFVIIIIAWITFEKLSKRSEKKQFDVE